MAASGTIEELRTFVLVVEAGSFAAAARSLGLSTNAVSQRVLALERAFGTSLLARTTRSMSLTAEGRVLCAHARRAIEALEIARDEMRTTKCDLHGPVRLAIPGGACSIDVLRGIGTILDAHPDLRLDIQVVNAQADPISGHFDVVLHAGSPPVRRVVARRLATVCWQLAATPEYLNRHGAPRKPGDLIGHRCLRMKSDRHQDSWHLVDKRGRTHVAHIRGAFEADDSRVLGDAVYAGLGIGVRPRRELADAASRGQLVRVLPRYSFEPIDLYSLIAPANARIPRITRLLDHLSDALQAVS